MTVTELFTPETISEITSQLWCAVVPEQEALEPGAPPGLRAACEWIAARVEIGGSWQGAVELRLSAAIGRAIAAAMFAVPEQELDESAVFDAVGELVNIVGGSLKSLLPPPTTLSLPTVSGEPEAISNGEGCEASFVWMAEPVLVRVLPATSQGGQGRSGGR